MKYLVVVLIIFGFGALMGSKTATPEVEFVTITKTRTVKTPAPPAKVVATMPVGCDDALKYAEIMTLAAEDIYNQGERQLAIISETREAMAAGDDINVPSNKQRRLRSTTVGALGDLEAAYYKYDLAVEKCEANK